MARLTPIKSSPKVSPAWTDIWINRVIKVTLSKYSATREQRNCVRNIKHFWWFSWQKPSRDNLQILCQQEMFACSTQRLALTIFVGKCNWESNINANSKAEATTMFFLAFFQLFWREIMPTNGFFNGSALVLRFLFLHSHECLLTLQIMCFFLYAFTRRRRGYCEGNVINTRFILSWLMQQHLGIIKDTRRYLRNI